MQLDNASQQMCTTILAILSLLQELLFLQKVFFVILTNTAFRSNFPFRPFLKVSRKASFDI